jgi:DNA-directed RNA polymerase
MTDAELTRFREWKHAASRVHQANARLNSKRLQLVRTMAMAERFAEFEEFFMVWQNDFRGRKYVVSSFLTPQGPDYSKALLRFARGVPLTEDGMYWLAVHGANCFGQDKVSFDDRNIWVYMNDEAIKACATDPYENTWWTEADDPWMFLAFCFEWAGAELGKPSHLPVSLDGSNNGLQHLSAIQRDLTGGESTNLVPHDVPADIYQNVADAVIKVLESRKAHDRMAQQWLDFGVTRKTTKRPVMVVPYGGRIYSTRQYIEDYIIDRIEAGVHNPWGHDLFEPSHYLADIVWQCISEVIVSARTVMDWLQEISSKISAENLPVIWETPTKFLVHQMYPETRSRRITTHIDNSLVKPQVREQNFGKSDRRRAVNGASPNFIHSLDSAAMTMTINRCFDAGIEDFAMVHDSYGVHASNVPTLFKLTRLAFWYMYEHNEVLEQFRNFALEVLDDVPEPPEKGDLDLSQVKDSKYFFA